MISDLLARHPFARDLTSDQVLAVADCATLVHVDPGTLVFREGDRADACYLLRAGHVGLQLHAPDGPLVVETLAGERVLGWSWLVPPHRWRFDAVAIDDVDALRLDARCLRRLLDTDPALGFAVSRILLATVSDRLEHTRIRLLDVYGHHHATGV